MEPFLEGPLLAEIWMIDSQNPEDDVFAKAVVRPEQKQLQPLKTPAAPDHWPVRLTTESFASAAPVSGIPLLPF